jgi:uncharacterized metal-binding protein
MAKRPIVYSCTGCSNVARIAHNVALNLDSDGIAEMSSFTIDNAVSMKVIATSGRSVIVIDGCDLVCTKTLLLNSNVDILKYFVITDLGINKRDKWQDSLTENSKAMV